MNNVQIEILKSGIAQGRVQIEFGYTNSLDTHKFELKYSAYFKYMQTLGFLADAKIITHPDETLIEGEFDARNPMTGEDETREFTCEITKYIQDNLFESERDVTKLVIEKQSNIIQTTAAEIAA